MYISRVGSYVSQWHLFDGGGVVLDQIRSISKYRVTANAEDEEEDKLFFLVSCAYSQDMYRYNKKVICIKLNWI